MPAERPGAREGAAAAVLGAAERRAVRTPVGEARVALLRAAEASVLLVAGHGAGGGIEARDLVALAAALPRHGVTVALVEQPWRVAGRRVAPAPKVLDTAWRAVLAELSQERAGRRLVVAGRSAGARVACRTAAEAGAESVVALAFPLHPPGRPERSRAGELTGAGVPVLVLQGERDPFGRPAEFAGLSWPGRLVAVPDGDHGFAVRRSGPVAEPEAMEVITRTVSAWLDAGGR